MPGTFAHQSQTPAAEGIAPPVPIRGLNLGSKREAEANQGKACQEAHGRYKKIAEVQISAKQVFSRFHTQNIEYHNQSAATHQI